MEETDKKENNEIELVSLAKAGDRSAFNRLVRGCAGQIYNLAFKLTNNKTNAEDLAQDAFINAYRNIGKFQQKCSFSSWVYRITVNQWKNTVKYEKRRFFSAHFSIDKPVDTEEGGLQRELSTNADNPAVLFEKNRKDRAVQLALNKLDGDDREMIIMRDIDDKSYEEISEILGAPLGTVKSRLSRAREGFRQKLIEQLKKV